MNNIQGNISTPSSLKLNNTPTLNTSNINLESATSNSASSGGGWSTSTFITIGLMIIVLALLGMNIFGYFADGVDILGSILQKLGIVTAKTAKKTVDLSMEGVKLGTDVAAGTVKDAATLVKKGVDLGAKDRTVSEAVDKKSTQKNAERRDIEEDSTEDSKIQKRGGKGGWCYIGTDRNIRSCIQVADSTRCMSGDIFPTREKCINPSLRG